MKRTAWSLVLLLLVAGPARAQGYLWFNPVPYDYDVSGGSVTFKHGHHHNTLSISVGAFTTRPIIAAPLYGLYPPTLLATPVFGPVISQQVTVVTYRPPPVLLPGPFIVDDLTRAVVPRPGEPEIPLNPRPLPERKPPGRNGGDKPAQPEAVPPPRPEPPKPPPAKPPDVPRIPHPNPEPRAENARLIELGKEAFADTDYGLAAQRFRQAGVVLPTDSQAQFLLAQALFAVGKYREAADAISAGLTLEPNWPALNFHPLELYGANVVLYPDHLRRLDDVAAHFPNDAVVLFLYGYELWFDGRKDEARALFLQALGAGADPDVIDCFLRALPPVGGV